ncbi:MAG: hypothetical protein ACLPXB_13170 [Thiobacillaceae bacterium]
MDTPAQYRILVGALRWQHAQWLGVFYPEELPAEWQLSFYNTQFRCVYVPNADWQTLSETDAGTWLTDTLVNFRFILQASNSSTQLGAGFLQALGPRALVESAANPHVHLLWFPPKPDLRALRQEIQRAADHGHELYLLSREGCLPAMEAVRSLVELMGY